MVLKNGPFFKNQHKAGKTDTVKQLTSQKKFQFRRCEKNAKMLNRQFYDKKKCWRSIL